MCSTCGNYNHYHHHHDIVYPSHNYVYPTFYPTSPYYYPTTYDSWALGDVVLRNTIAPYDMANYRVVGRNCDSYASCLSVNNRVILLDRDNNNNNNNNNKNNNSNDNLDMIQCKRENKVYCPSGMEATTLKDEQGQDVKMCKFINDKNQSEYIPATQTEDQCKMAFRAMIN